MDKDGMVYVAQSQRYLAEMRRLEKEVKELRAKADIPITEHPDVQRLIRQVVELQEEGKLLREEMETRNMASSKALDELWKEIILKKSPGYGDWEYPMQAMRHIVCEFEELQAENVKMKAALKKYGQHTKICEDEKYPEVWHCICGFEQALKGE